MLYDLGFLEKGSVWPPVGEAGRLGRYAHNRGIFNGTGEGQLRFGRLMALKFADLLFGEPPRIAIGGTDWRPPEGFLERAYEVAIDVCRYGTGLFSVHRGLEGGVPVLDISQPQHWFVVVDRFNIKRVLWHVLAAEIPAVACSGADGAGRLEVQVHGVGEVWLRSYELSDGVVGEMLAEERVDTGLDGFAVLPVHNVATSDSYFGMDDFGPIEGLVDEVGARMAQVSRILDKHAEPTMQGPGSALVDDGHGNLHLGTGNYIVNDSLFDTGISKVEYITWEAQLGPSFKQLEQLLQFLYMMSETGATLLDASPEAAQAQSGTALRLRMMSPLAKVNRLRARFDPVIRQAVVHLAKMDGVLVSVGDVSIIWEDGLPDDPMESAQIMQIRTGGAPTIGAREAIKRLDGVGDDMAQRMVDEI